MTDGMLSHEIQALDSQLRDRDPLTALTWSLADMRTFRSLHRALHERLVYEVLDRPPTQWTGR